jgi:hypothetical protein
VAVTVGFDPKSIGISLLCRAFLDRVSASFGLSSMCAAVLGATRYFSHVTHEVRHLDVPDVGQS